MNFPHSIDVSSVCCLFPLLCRSFQFDVVSLFLTCFFFLLLLMLLVSDQKKIKKSLPRRISRSFNPLFSSSRLTTADLMLKYFIHFELIFICISMIERCWVHIHIFVDSYAFLLLRNVYSKLLSVCKIW